MRLDVYLFEYGYADSRAKAKFLLMEGAVTFDGKTKLKPSAEVDETASHTVEIKEACPYVSVGGMKLEAAFERFGISSADAVCADIGASTGGFTDCLLQHGAIRVYAVDSGTSQLHEKLRADSRVISMENTNARDITRDDIGEEVSIAVCDVSFISQRLVLPAITDILALGGRFITLIKPQFELDRARVGRGIVTEPSHRADAIYSVITSAAENGLSFRAITLSPVSGGGINDERAAKRGNREYVALFEKTNETKLTVTEREIKEYVKNENSTDTATRYKRK